MLDRLSNVIGAYPTAPYEMVSAWSLVGFAVAGCYGTPDYAILTGHTPLHPPVWAWMAWCASWGLWRVRTVVWGHFPSRQLLCLLSFCTWGLIWLTLFWHHGAVASLCLIPPVAVSDLLAYFQTGDVAWQMRRGGG